MAWKQNGGGNSGLAAELLRSLFSGQVGHKSKPQKEEWPCKTCGVKNYMTRSSCRQCKSAKNGPKKIPTPSQPAVKSPPTKPAALAPWATREMLESREAALSSALEATKTCVGCDAAVSSIEAELASLRKRSADPPSVHKNIEDTRGFIGRAEKRHQSLVDEVSVLKEREQAAFQELWKRPGSDSGRWKPKHAKL